MKNIGVKSQGVKKTAISLAGNSRGWSIVRKNDILGGPSRKVKIMGLSKSVIS